jgi:hypothetical protein
MIQVPDNFPSYTSYSPKTLIMQVDTLKACVRELQQEIAALKTTQVPAAAKIKKDAANA